MRGYKIGDILQWLRLLSLPNLLVNTLIFTGLIHILFTTIIVSLIVSMILLQR